MKYASERKVIWAIMQILFAEKDVTQTQKSTSQISRDVDDLLNITNEDAITDVRKPKHKSVRLPAQSGGQHAAKRKCQRAMVAGKGTSSGNTTTTEFRKSLIPRVA